MVNQQCMWTDEDIEKNRKWLEKSYKHRGCLYNHNPEKCLFLFPFLYRNRNKKCGHYCPCEQYKTRHVKAVVARYLAGLATV